MLVISSKEFRNNQKKYFDLLDTNVQIVVQRGKDKAYLLTPLSDAEALSTNPALLERVKAAEKSIESGETITITDPQNIWASIL
ncbi:type II toxin-antitoxin system Phd/YefM family antitoxin [uncultured Mucilaginibacter sp.]|uniref:type II toxin-antitoxin system Phd/YefM family antitoxin n=1 Tax=uncultured Mucilaginibacter sp. TaxID=797541 RepID=UPI00262966AA|nr:type II toxin-antitoxin system Phd/YefM family antitoxin [uncultured Mucilaginibacter sp.]